jgi:hypothetical protein
MKGISYNGYVDHLGKLQELFSEREKEMLGLASAIVELLPETTPDGELIRCHEVARIVGCLLKLEVQDGKYGLHDHSWLWTGPFHPRWPRSLDPPKILVRVRLPAESRRGAAALLGFDRVLRPEVPTSKWWHTPGKYLYGHDAGAEHRCLMSLGVNIVEV